MDEWFRLGIFLRAARERRRIPLEDIARQTRIPLGLLRKLEDGRRDALPPAVFVSGFVRAYARCLGLAPAEVEHLHGELLNRERPRARESLSPPRAPTASRQPLALWLVIIALIIATLALSLLWSHRVDATFGGERAAPHER